MNEETQLKAFVAFLAIFSMMALSHAALAAISVSPTVPGYSAASGGYRAPAGSFTMAPANAGYIQPAVANVGGKPITVPAKLRMAANAGQFVKNAMKLNPWAIAGTLAAGWLLNEGIEYVNGQWQKKQPDYEGYPGYLWSWTGNTSRPCSTASPCPFVEAQDAAAQYWFASQPQYYGVEFTTCTGASTVQCGFTYCYNGTCGYNGGTISFQAQTPNSDPYRPMTDPDWDALPDPLPAVAPELPFAPYMPDGAPVEAPGYDFAPFNTPLGSPYTKPDGSTVQPMASVSPNGDSITIDTFDQPLTDSAGNPAPNPQPQDTPEPQPSQCEKHPETLGCATLGTAPDATLTTEQKSIAQITPITGGALGASGQCPAPLTTSFMGTPISFSYDLPCQAASMLRPLILALAWLSAGVIFIGGVRQ